MAETPSRSALEFLGRLAGGLVHEIKNPLSTITINLTLLREDLDAALPEDRALMRRLDLVRKEVDRLESVLEGFMRYAGLRRLEPAVLDLAALLDDVLEFLRPGFRRDGVEIAAELERVSVRADASLLKQAVLNLLLNAQEAMSSGGTVSVRLLRADGRAVVEIADEGCGIPEEVRARVFEVYFSASRTGSGLGLPTARRIVEEHGGTLVLESKEGRGTTVRLELPAEEA